MRLCCWTSENILMGSCKVLIHAIPFLRKNRKPGQFRLKALLVFFAKPSLFNFRSFGRGRHELLSSKWGRAGVLVYYSSIFLIFPSSAIIYKISSIFQSALDPFIKPASRIILKTDRQTSATAPALIIGWYQLFRVNHSMYSTGRKTDLFHENSKESWEKSQQ